MKAIICGGRDYIPQVDDFARLDRLHDQYHFTLILSGAARGADQFGEQWGAKRGIPVKRFPAGWNTYGKRAGLLRNEQMAMEADAVIAFPGGTGTAHMVACGKRRGLKIFRRQ